MSQVIEKQCYCGHKLLDKAALAAVRKWKFEPTKENAIAIASWVRVPIEFIIQ